MEYLDYFLDHINDTTLFHKRYEDIRFTQLLHDLENPVRSQEIIQYLSEKEPVYNKTYPLGTYGNFLFGCILGNQDQHTECIRQTLHTVIIKGIYKNESYHFTIESSSTHDKEQVQYQLHLQEPLKRKLNSEEYAALHSMGIQTLSVMIQEPDKKLILRNSVPLLALTQFEQKSPSLKHKKNNITRNQQGNTHHSSTSFWKLILYIGVVTVICSITKVFYGSRSTQRLS